LQHRSRVGVSYLFNIFVPSLALPKNGFPLISYGLKGRLLFADKSQENQWGVLQDDKGNLEFVVTEDVPEEIVCWMRDNPKTRRLQPNPEASMIASSSK